MLVVHTRVRAIFHGRTLSTLSISAHRCIRPELWERLTGMIVSVLGGRTTFNKLYTFPDDAPYMNSSSWLHLITPWLMSISCFSWSLGLGCRRQLYQPRWHYAGTWLPNFNSTFCSPRTRYADHWLLLRLFAHGYKWHPLETDWQVGKWQLCEKLPYESSEYNGMPVDYLVPSWVLLFEHQPWHRRT